MWAFSDTSLYVLSHIDKLYESNRLAADRESPRCSKFQGSNLLPFRLSEKDKNCGRKAKVGGGFPPERYPFKPLLMLKSRGFPVRKVEMGAER